MENLITCRPRRFRDEMMHRAAAVAIEHNPMNRPPVEKLSRLLPPGTVDRSFLSVLTAKRWRTNGVHLTVGFLDNPPADLRARIIGHMNAWGQTANVSFRETRQDAKVRIARIVGGEDGGHWSNLGTDILLVDGEQPTMNLEGFTMRTPDSEFYRVVRHETGHTLGFPHEHMRRDLVERIDEQRAIEFYLADQGWTEEETRQQVLTPIEEGSLLGTARADSNSIMCYQVPGALTQDGAPIPGGNDIDELDYEFAAICYPKPPQR